jgi:hypothetical protein
MDTLLTEKDNQQGRISSRTHQDLRPYKILCGYAMCDMSLSHRFLPSQQEGNLISVLISGQGLSKLKLLEITVRSTLPGVWQ